METNTTKVPLLKVKDFAITFPHYGKGLLQSNMEVIQKLDITIFPGEIVAVVGASGSGKSLLADAILGILPDHAQTSGMLRYKGEELTKEKQLALRGKEISLIPQSVNALDPLMKTARQVQGAVKMGNKEKRQQDVFAKVGLATTAGKKYPFELSGGMNRRVLAATAMVSEAKLIIADEPTPGLDPKALQETTQQLKQLVTASKGMMLITHDMETALQLADRIVVFYQGKTVETVKLADFSGDGERLQHPYTKALWQALPQTDFRASPSEKSESNREETEWNTDKSTPTQHTGKLDVIGVGYHYPNADWLFQQLDITISPGEIVGILGDSGSGKSTLAQIIAGYIAPLEGKIMVEDKPKSAFDIHPIQLIWQHPEKVINPRWRMARMLEEAGGLGEKGMELLGIKQEWLSRFPSELSGGELQRFCIARAIAGDAKYLIADEITTMLDAVTQAQIWKIMFTIAKERHIGVLAISHNHALLARISDRIINFNELIS